MAQKRTDGNGSTPATQHDLALLAGYIAQRFDQIETRLATIEDGMVTEHHLQQLATKDDLERFATKDELEKVLRIQEAILTTVQSIDGRLQDMNDHTDRIIRLEEEVFRPGR